MLIPIVLQHLVLLLALLLAIWLIFTRISRFHVLLDRLPGPTALPILGNALQIRDAKKILEVLYDKWPRTYGDIFRMLAGGEAYVVISSPELAETILKSQKFIEKGKPAEKLAFWLGYGLINIGGDIWKQRRRLINPSFHTEMLNDFIGLFNDHSKTFAKILREKSEASNGKPIEVSFLASQCTLDIICDATLGLKINAQTAVSEFANVINQAGDIVMELMFQPWLSLPIMSSLSSKGREISRTKKFLNDFADQVIDNRKRYLEEKHLESSEVDNNKKRSALVDSLLTASEYGKTLSLDDIRSEIHTFFFAGSETTSVLIGWFLYLMALHPEEQEKVRQELVEIFGDSDRDCTVEDLAKMKYLECCIKETLRLYPSIPAVERLATDDVHLGGYVIPRGSNIIVSIRMLQRDPRQYEEPEQFKPERFFVEQGNQKHKYSFVPFSAGPRNCIGQRFAMMEAKVVFSTLLRNLAFELSEECEEPVPSMQVSLKSLTGINLVIKPNP